MNHETLVRQTPLRFHRFYHYVLIPLNLIMLLINLINSLNLDLPYGYEWVGKVDAFTALVGIALYLVAFVGFFSWSKAAFSCALAMEWFSVLYTLYTVILMQTLRIPDFSVGTLLGSVLRASLISVYYSKRRPLFFPELLDSSFYTDRYRTEDAPRQSLSSIPSLHESAFPAPAEPPAPVSAAPEQAGARCAQCGLPVAEGDVFCSFCGQKLPGAGDPPQ